MEIEIDFLPTWPEYGINTWYGIGMILADLVVKGFILLRLSYKQSRIASTTC